MKAIIYTDGGCQPNPGPCSYGVVILDNEENVISLMSEYIGEGTNNLGELTGIYRGIQRARELGFREVELYTDSEVCLKILKKKATNVERLQPVLEKCLKALEGLDVKMEWVKGHADIQWNEMADRLANSALEFAKGRDEKPQAPKVLRLNCPFAEKDLVKGKGARWNAAMKKWMVADTPENREAFAKWL